MALAMIEGAEARGALQPGMRVVEFTGGSTGSSLGMVCAVKGYACVVLSSDAFAEEKLRTMRAFGAELRIVPSDGGKVTPALFERFREGDRGARGRAGHVLDGSVPQRGRDRRLRRRSAANCWSRPAAASTCSAAPSGPAAC